MFSWEPRGRSPRDRPVIYVENDREEQSAGLIGCLLGMNYRLWWHVPFLYNPDNFLANPENVYPGVVSFNMLCLPAEQAAQIAVA